MTVATDEQPRLNEISSSPALAECDTQTTRQVIRRVTANQMLFQAGNSLTSGSFFNYFVAGFSPSATWLSLIMIIPEVMQSLCILLNRLCGRLFERRTVWISGLVLARLACLVIPFALLLDRNTANARFAIPYIFLCTALWHFFQGISFTHYVSWISGLVDRERWGKLLSYRQVGGLAIGIFFPIGTLLLRNQILKGLPAAIEQWSYACIFAAGNLLVLSSILPLFRVEHHLKHRLPRAQTTHVQSLGKKWFYELIFSASKSDFRRLLATRWTAAFFQGLTQAVLFKYLYNELKIPILTYMMMISLMLLVQLPMAWWGGKLSDAGRDRFGIVLGLLLASLSMPCWLLADRDSTWLIGVAYMLWGGFGLVNVCGLSLCLKLADSKENINSITCYEQFSGLIAGGAGLLGGVLLDALFRVQATQLSYETSPALPYLILIAASWIGRTIAPCLMVGRVNQRS